MTTKENIDNGNASYCELMEAWQYGIERIAELEKTCKSRSDTIIEYSNKIAELEKVELETVTKTRKLEQKLKEQIK